MHEISLIRSVFRTIEEAFPGKMPQVKKVKIKAGILSNVQPILMQNALLAVQEDDPTYAHIAIEIEVLPILIQCIDCETITEVTQYTFICKQCTKPSKNIIQGEELLISQVEFDDEL